MNLSDENYLLLYVISNIVYLIITVACAAVLYKIVARREESILDYPFGLCILGYGILCSSSSLYRAESGVLLSIDRIEPRQFVLAIIWLLSAQSALLLAYILGVRTKRRFELRLHDICETDRKAIYKVCFIVGLILLIINVINPFASKDYGMLTAVNKSGLETGGAMFGMFVFHPLAALVPAIYLFNKICGAAFGIYIIVSFILSGSKGNAAAYLFIALMQINILQRKRLQKQVKNLLGSIFKRGWMLLAYSSIAAVLITLSVSARYGDNKLNFKESIGGTLIRFNHHDLAEILYSETAWRENARFEYISNIFQSFVPGIFWKDKPLNFAYEINSLTGSNFTAASPSIYGSVLLIADNTLFFPCIFILGLVLGYSDRVLRTLLKINISEGIAWILVYTSCMIMEANWVLFICFYTCIYGVRALVSITLRSKARR
jgi:hypothetical protein